MKNLSNNILLEMKLFDLGSLDGQLLYLSAVLFKNILNSATFVS